MEEKTGVVDDIVGNARDLAVNGGQLIAQSGGLALGVAWVVACISLFAYYYSVIYTDPYIDDFKRSFSSRKGLEAKDSADPSLNSVLIKLEAAFNKWGVAAKDRDCWSKVVCESFLPEARTKNSKVSDTITRILNEAKNVKWTKKPQKDENYLRHLIAAAHDGYDQHSCASYESSCPNVTISQLPQNK